MSSVVISSKYFWLDLYNLNWLLPYIFLLLVNIKLKVILSVGVYRSYGNVLR